MQLRARRHSPSRGLWQWPVLWLALTILVSAAGSRPQQQEMLPFSPVTEFPGEQKLVSRARISREAADKVPALLSRDPVSAGQAVFPRIRTRDVLMVGDQPVDMMLGTSHPTPLLWQLDTRALQRALAEGADRLALTVTLRDGSVGGWQTTAGARESTPPLVTHGLAYGSSLEMRHVDPARNSAVFVGY